jgi:hypothetical protein
MNFALECVTLFSERRKQNENPEDCCIDRFSAPRRAPGGVLADARRAARWDDQSSNRATPANAVARALCRDSESGIGVLPTTRWQD